MKLQQLLNIYKDKVHKGIYDYILYLEEDNKITYVYHQEDGKIKTIEKSLSDLLFSTPFLTLLERKIDTSEKVWIHQYIKDERFIEGYSTYENYHKINLVLLNTDAERIEYIEQFTL